VRVVYLLRKRPFVGGKWLCLAKQLVILAYTVVQLSVLIISAANFGRLRPFFVSSSVLAVVSGICIVALSYLEHSRSPRPSHLLTAYLALTILFDVAQTRTLWLASPRTSAEIAFSRLFTAALATKAVLVVLESGHKSRWIRWADSNVKGEADHSPEETSGLFDLGAFSWLNRLFLRGYRKVMTIDDLYPVDRSMASETLHARLVDALGTPGQEFGLAKGMARALAIPLLLPVAPRVAMGAFQFCQPFLIDTLLQYLQQQPGSQTSHHSIGYGLIGATILIYSGIGVSQAFHWYYQERAMYMVRGALAGAIYKKTTEAKVSATDDKAALTLMSTDVERVIQGFTSMHEFWANTIQVGLACWLLSKQIGAAFIAPLIVVGCCAVCSAVLGKHIPPRQMAWMGKIQRRVGVTAAMIGQMKHLKISGLVAPVENMVQRMRLDELNTGSRFRIVMVLSAVLGFTPLCLSPVITFAFTSRTLDVSTIFTSISYLLLLATPLGTLFQMYPGLLAASTCLDRIQSFLEQDPRSDFRQLHQSSSSEKTSINIRDKATEGVGPSPTISMSAASFGYETGKPTLKDVDLRIPTSTLTMVIGPVASGKSTLCKALLGEIPVVDGVVEVAGPIGKVGYCEQTPFLTNSTIRENIVGFAVFDPVRYKEVVEATMLQADLDTLPQGDETKVGSNGIALSGGQKQRVSIARALYLDSEVFVFDDILSGLDADTEEEIFHRVLSRDGLLRRRKATIVLCTHSIRHLAAADHVIALGTDGRIIEQGTFPELVANRQYAYDLKVKERDHSTASQEIERSSDSNAVPRSGQVPSSSAKVAASSQVENPARMLGDTTVYSHYIARIDALSIGSFIVFGLGWGFFSNFTTIWLKFWSEDASSAHPRHSNAFYVGIYALFQALTLISLFSLCLTTFLAMIRSVGAKLHHEALKMVINAPLRFFATTDVGVVTNLFSQDMTLIDGQLPMALVNLALYSFSCVAMAAVIATSSPYLAISYPFLLALLYGIQKFYLRTSRQMRLLDLEAKSPL
jgi:ATP-binding cassette subfamily C (CFTR/MRP) protein 1